MSQVALVTGAARGIGAEVARGLAQRGMSVVVGARSPTEPDHVRLDVTDLTTVRAAIGEVTARHGRLDVLVNNAGAIAEAPAFETGPDELRATFETNVFGVAAVTRACLPLLAASSAPRIVNVSSTTASLTRTAAGVDFGGDAGRRLAYSASKAALNMLTVQYARAAERDPHLAGRLKVNAAAPGFVATALNGFSGTRSVAEGAAIVVRLATLGADGPTGGFFNDDGPVEW